MDGLARLFDVGTCFAPVDLSTAGATGKRLSIKGASATAVMVSLAAAASGTETVTLTLKEHTASSAGTTQDLAVIDHYWIKAEATLDNDEAWTKVTQTAAATVALTGATYATQEALVIIPVNTASVSDGYTHISLDASDPGTVARLASAQYLPHDLLVQRAPEMLASLLG
ncbi:hypothetical protein ACFUTR_23295 [Streptomyces sp. NPDC057367]|uniref:hypothetical protein n=1 Tax=Streptomyces sp. NPDC057367 TaxID=3346108 RepID=UPI00362DED88